MTPRTQQPVPVILGSSIPALKPTFEVNVVDQNHGCFRVQVLHLVLDHVMCFGCNESVDLLSSRSRFVEVDFEELPREVSLHSGSVCLQRTEALSKCHCVAEGQCRVAITGKDHGEKMGIGFINLLLGERVVAQCGDQLMVAFFSGSFGQHGQGGGDAKG